MKAEDPMLVTVLGIEILVTPEIPEKAEFSIVVTLLPKVISFNEEGTAVSQTLFWPYSFSPSVVALGTSHADYCNKYQTW